MLLPAHSFASPPTPFKSLPYPSGGAASLPRSSLPPTHFSLFTFHYSLRRSAPPHRRQHLLHRGQQPQRPHPATCRSVALTCRGARPATCRVSAATCRDAPLPPPLFHSTIYNSHFARLSPTYLAASITCSFLLPNKNTMFASNPLNRLAFIFRMP